MNSLYRINSNLIRRRRMIGLPVKTGASSSAAVGTGTITVTSPVQYQVFQRGVGGQGTITITGTYTGTPGAMEASFNGSGWTRLSDTPAGGNFSGSIANQNGGQGTLAVRWIGNPASEVDVLTVGVGDIFIIAGQSNAVGMTAGNQSYSHATLYATRFGNNYAWGNLVDPVDSSTGQVDTVSSDACGGSMYPLLATSFMASQGVPCAFVPCAKGGSAIVDWAVPTNHQDRTTLYGSMIYRALQTGSKGILWWQGESDVINATTRADYNSQLDAIANAVYADLGCKMMVCKLEDMSNAGVWTGNEANVNLAIGDAWADNSNVIAGPDLSIWTPNGDIHYSSAEAPTIAGYWWSAMQAAWGYT